METITKENVRTVSDAIETTLRLLGLNNSYKGFKFLIYGIELAINNPNILTYICKGFYVDIAIHYGTTLNCVERDIRTAKEAVWANGNKALLFDIFGASEKHEIPNNSQFVDVLSYYIKNNF